MPDSKRFVGEPAMKSEEPSLKHVDLILDELESALDTPIEPQEEGDESYQLYFDFPPQVWKDFLSYCKQNELDPAQQLREAAVSYYRDQVAQYRTRKKAFDSVNLK
jgi:hypothetical protein